MENIQPGEKINQPQQFIGYWGYGSGRELEARLSIIKTLHTTSHQLSELDWLSENNYPIWNVAHIGFSQESILPIHHPERIAAISASGIFTYLESDIWVKVHRSDIA
ncbi:hypothetical protein LC613_38500 [Nostoc sphaeroides CHAB 2801]|uniref:hypothetical protein n=1 Tax=Nostoc sphaeroides TaxID=446679 RepID=UPI001E314A80|nr:hypothetical protein [Nostoc sphaeroides]MCC5633366.1 hypothetical protein [Nostoc sphaeroides CHAB 2801]